MQPMNGVPFDVAWRCRKEEFPDIVMRHLPPMQCAANVQAVARIAGQAGGMMMRTGVRVYFVSPPGVSNCGVPSEIVPGEVIRGPAGTDFDLSGAAALGMTPRQLLYELIPNKYATCARANGFIYLFNGDGSVLQGDPAPGSTVFLHSLFFFPSRM